MKIIIETIAHSAQRYPTVGDWYWERPPEKDWYWGPPEKDEGFTAASAENTLHIKVSDLFDRREQLLIGVHELVEAWMCLLRDIRQEDVDAWDKTFEGDGEPGDDPSCPYYGAHTFATAIERQLAEGLWVDWASYNKDIDLMFPAPNDVIQGPTDDDIPF